MAVPTKLRPILTKRQLQILSLVSHGFSSSEIAAELSIETVTVRNHVHRILAALQASDRAHAVRIGFEEDLLVESRERRPRNPGR
jgi:DNA-binding NarL/FixJ family response regulator